MRQEGFSLVEILVAMTIMSILLSVATLNYNSMKRKADIEKQTREIYASIIGTRLTAMQNKQRSIIFFEPNRYQFKVYSSSAEPKTAGVVRSTVTLPFTIQKVTTGLVDFDSTNNELEFDTNGMTTDNMTFATTPVFYNEGTNCIVVHTVRTNIGRMSSATNCTIK